MITFVSWEYNEILKIGYVLQPVVEHGQDNNPKIDFSPCKQLICNQFLKAQPRGQHEQTHTQLVFQTILDNQVLICNMEVLPLAGNNEKCHDLT